VALLYGLMMDVQRFSTRTIHLLHEANVGFPFGIVRCTSNAVFTQITES